ncbi:molybdenum cofactor synthesis domain-containing protein [Tepidamorphus gemmatus]|uniref:Molybdenum cofactor synthesis domain-containing protein n=1 Tax=Tepidamorphus gemmatus TaxID=747076 RepID=A0A4R3MGD9_9HYPH|nr:competence/damage-inducible protein A [Tepidamorphus gemmatus]TCT12681.1 molybdenum cofactor synthesis domain-containing protein [Tepidamorphus gemmatus]
MGEATAGDGGEVVTAAVLVIGDEILSGRTKDRNIGYIAEYLTALGIDLREARIVPDVVSEIAAAVNALRGRYTYVFTTGGIGPTHDDITADGIAEAFGVPVHHDPRAVEILKAYLGDRLNEARLRMARMPVGSELIENTVSKAPGWRIGNVYVMAGIPSVMHAMLDAIAPTLRTGTVIESRTVEGRGIKEGDVGGPLGDIQAAFPQVMIGSYPHFDGNQFTTSLVLRSRDTAALDAAEAQVRALVERLLAEVRP